MLNISSLAFTNQSCYATIVYIDYDLLRGNWRVIKNTFWYMLACSRFLRALVLKSSLARKMQKITYT